MYRLFKKSILVPYGSICELSASGKSASTRALWLRFASKQIFASRLGDLPHAPS